MTRAMLPPPAALLVLLAGACAGGARIAGTVPIPPDATRSLHVEAPVAKDMVLELWNRGPGRVAYRSVSPSTEAVTSGGLDPVGGDARWSVTAQHFAVELTADAAGATVGYTVRATGSLSVETRQPLPPPEQPPAPQQPQTQPPER